MSQSVTTADVRTAFVGLVHAWKRAGITYPVHNGPTLTSEDLILSEGGAYAPWTIFYRYPDSGATSTVYQLGISRREAHAAICALREGIWLTLATN